MNILTLTLRFWELVHHLVNREGLRLVHLDNNGSEVWIEDDRKEPYQIIRIAQKDFDWSSELQRDIEQTYQRAGEVRKKLGLRSANMVNVVLTLYEPVDQYEELVNVALPFTVGGKQQQRTILIPVDNLNEKLFPLATEWQLNEAPRFTDIHELTDEEAMIRSLRYAVQQSSQQRLEGERRLFLYGKPLFTYLLMGIILAVFAIIEIFGSSTDTQTLIRFGAKFNPLILEGEWWRFFSAMFLHIGIVHLLMNSLALFYLGSTVERIYGTSRFIFIYFVAGFAGSLASFAFNEQVSAGASGAIFGCFGALLYFGMMHRRLFFRTMGMNVIVILIINLVFGFVVQVVDNGAHIGGLIGGFFASVIVGLPKHRYQLKQLAAGAVFAAGLVALLLYAYSQEETSQTRAVYFQLGYEYLQQELMEEARPYFEKIVAGDYEEDEMLITEAYFYLAYIQAMTEDILDAKDNLIKAIERNPLFHEAHYNLALIYIDLEDEEKAFEHVQQALEIQPDTESYQQLKKELQQYVD
ncbi:rhomboid protease GluP [Evansella caseinilytica]|uniref:Rhomboid protease GluP n=1 Tax=Evansella caseinilytica TaxID=1503961 RepID=A0A1H3KRJ7_9BACI|nr:rhomboid family intramembrane serine protease [Evansella caseinilytica]SDY54285.1 rhomboid protease GluP [Evansella caseinilytica]